jgi:hypothetical protein
VFPIQENSSELMYFISDNSHCEGNLIGKPEDTATAAKRHFDHK